jgi:hypothetical protein
MTHHGASRGRGTRPFFNSAAVDTPLESPSPPWTKHFLLVLEGGPPLGSPEANNTPCFAAGSGAAQTDSRGRREPPGPCGVGTPAFPVSSAGRWEFPGGLSRLAATAKGRVNRALLRRSYLGLATYYPSRGKPSSPYGVTRCAESDWAPMSMTLRIVRPRAVLTRPSRRADWSW